ncbi:hypothetical protein [Sphingomonas sp. H160509]|uniref:hypothetical protein n=1 Tax=Sphingomonas sp. H160509 TaxID=2955313 RepID=UPI0031593B67
MFDNVSAGAALSGPPTGATAVMAQQMADTWMAFARSGNPDNPCIPPWAPNDLERRTTMLFNVPPRAIADPFKAEREFFTQFPTQQGSAGRYRSAS